MFRQAVPYISTSRLLDRLAGAGPLRGALGSLALAAAVAMVSCAAESREVTPADAPPRISIEAAPVVTQPIAHVLRVSGSLLPDEQAEVGAEIAGRVVATPVERGTAVAAGAVLVRVAADEAGAQLREAEANAAQIEARLGLQTDQPFVPEDVPEVRNARATLALAEAEFERIESLLSQRVVSQSEYDQRRTQVEAARQQHQAALNGAQQSFRALEAARARAAVARKSVADTTVRAPFAGQVVERRVSVGDYVTRGTVVATVVRIRPLRLELTVPEQSIALVTAGQRVQFRVDAFPDEVFEGEVRHIAPALRTDQRALIVEAIVANEDGRLKPGLFATAELTEAERRPALLVPSGAVRTSAGTSRVYVVTDGRVVERIVRTGRTGGALVEIVEGLSAGEIVATGNLGRLTDGAAVEIVILPANS